MELQKIIGANVKAIRDRKKLTLDAAAQLSGVSRSMLAQMETVSYTHLTLPTILLV